MGKNKNFESFANKMSMDIIEKLEGSHPDFKRIEVADSPSKIIVLGTLGDKSTDRSGGKNEERTLSSVKNNSLTVKFLLSQFGELKIQPSFSLYYRVYPTYDEQKKYVNENYDTEVEKVNLARIWKRGEFKLEPVKIILDENEQIIPFQLANQVNEIKKDKYTWSGGTDIEYASLKTEKNYLETLDKIHKNRIPPFAWKATLSIRTENFNQKKKTLKLISVTFTNETEETRGAYETFLFNCHLNVYLGEQTIKKFVHEYEYEGFPYAYESSLRCLNCHALYDASANVIKTKHYSNFRQEKIEPKINIENILFTFDSLSNDPYEILKKFNDYIKKKISSYENDSEYQSNNEFKVKTDHLKQLQKRYEDGINVLINNEDAMKAFKLLNKTFNKASVYPGWRAFQLFFIICLIPDIVDKQLRRDLCEVLHVDTGGGKSEAYFGCVIFSAFWDRLTGKKYGTTAITKFPLRMLSVQQLERIARVLIWAESVRKAEKINGEPFSVGYYVGSSDEFPRYSKTLIEKINKAKSLGKEINGKIIDRCPLCAGTVTLETKPENYIIHKCSNCKEEFRLFFTDEELYRFIPTFIISTVDKLAGISMNRRLKNIFGGKIDKCLAGHGYIPHNDSCEVQMGKEKCDSPSEVCNISFSTAPTLIIQDEMHLIKEGFGTIDSHFESLIELIQYKLSGYKPKYVTMTATMTGAKQQIKHLYNKDINIFPGTSPKGKGIDDIFFEYKVEEDKKNNAQRLIIGLKPNLRDNQFASLLTMKYISEYIQKIESSVAYYAKEFDIDQKTLTEIIPLYKRILTYHNKKSDVHSLNYYLEAVVNSKLQDYKIFLKTLTGDNTLDDIKDTINQVVNYYNVPENQHRIMSVSATSVVSHGVDISDWNIMIFQGVPRGTAEYIQALSRIGRRDVGIVFIWFYPNRARDLSYYQNFEDFHKILNHMVEHVPLCRWATLGFKETFTSIFNASILNYYASIEGMPIYNVDQVNQIFKSTLKRHELIEFIKDAYFAHSNMAGAQYFNDKIPEEVERRLNYLVNYTGGQKNFFPNALKDSDIKEYKTQYGMRGIQDELRLNPSRFDIPILEKTIRGDD